MTQTNGITRTIDWQDIGSALLVGSVALPIKLMALSRPEWELSGPTAAVPFLIILAYVFIRARREPQKLDDWGLTTPLTMPAVLTAIAMLLGAILFLALCGTLLGSGLPFEARHLSHMVNYIDDGFCQQFYMCSVGLASLATLRMFQGTWRLPLFVGMIFGLAHFWTPHLIPGTFIPVQVLITFPVGFLAAWYFLRFRSIVPLTLIHAIGYILLHSWVEVQL